MYVPKLYISKSRYLCSNYEHFWSTALKQSKIGKKMKNAMVNSW